MKQEQKRSKVLNQNINSAKNDHAIRMKIKNKEICFPKRPYSPHLGFK